MRIPALPAALLFAVLGSSCHPGAQLQVTWEVDCDLQIATLPEPLALPLVPDLRDPRRAEGAYKDVQKLLAEKKAVLVGWPIITTKSGQRAVIEQVDEIRYPTAFSPPSVGVTPNLAVDQSIQVEPKVDVTAFDSAPTEFETRNAGVTFEVEPVVSMDGEMIEISMVPQSTHVLEWTQTTLEKDPPGAKLVDNQPHFLVNKTTTSMVFRNGERKLIGVFKLTEPAGHVELFILRIDATKEKVVTERLPPRPSAPPPSAPAPGPPADATRDGSPFAPTPPPPPE